MRIVSDGKKTKDEKIGIFALCVLVFLPNINTFVNCFFQLGLEVATDGLTEVVYIFMLFISFMGLIRFFGKDKKLFALALIIMGMLFLSYNIYPSIRDTIYGNPVDLIYNPINVVTFYCIPIMFIAYSIDNYDRLFVNMLWWSVCTLTVGLITFYYCTFIAEVTLQYMIFSYALLTSICVCFEGWFLKKNVLYLVLGILGSIAILICGARGAVISVLVYLLLRIVFGLRSKNTIIKYSVIILLVCCVLLLNIDYENLLMKIDSLLGNMGIESRFFSSLLSSSLFEDEGRTKLSDIFVQAIKENPFGYGAFGDRYATYKLGWEKPIYLHNLFLEIICDFGIFLGPLIIVWIVINLLRCLFASRNSDAVRILWCLVPFGIIQLMFSSSFWEIKEFWIILIITYKIMKSKRKKQI